MRLKRFKREFISSVAGYDDDGVSSTTSTVGSGAKFCVVVVVTLSLCSILVFTTGAVSCRRVSGLRASSLAGALIWLDVGCSGVVGGAWLLATTSS